MKTERCRWAMALGVAGLAALGSQAATIRSETCGLTIRDSVVVALTNRLTGEWFAVDPGSNIRLAGLRRAGEPARPTSGFSEATTAAGIEQSWSFQEGSQQLLTRLQKIESSGDLAVTQMGRDGRGKLAAVSWGLGNIPDRYEVLVPGHSGQRFSSDAPAGRQEFDYPMGWEAPFVLIQGTNGGVMIWAEDTRPLFKNLTVEHVQRSFRLRFESRNLAPVEKLQTVVSSRWRITPYRGSWRDGAAIYRGWMRERDKPTPVENHRPSWARDIQFVAIMDLEQRTLKALAGRCHPAQTLLYVPGWRKSGYDRNYPDYEAVPAFGPFVREAHALGFRVMAHVNYFGCDPKHALYAEFKAAQMRDPATRELLWWEWPDDPPIKFAYINPASRAWRKCFIERMRALCQAYPLDALHLDQTLCIYNDANGLIDGLTCLEGNLLLHRELREALPEVALSGEGLNEVTYRYESFAQRHVWGMDHAHGTWDDQLIAMAHPVSSAVLTPFTRIYGYLGMANPGNGPAFFAWCRAYERFGALPTYAWPDEKQLDRPSPAASGLLAQAAYFQKRQPAPAWDQPWDANDLFVWQVAGGGRLTCRREAGVALVETSPTGASTTLSRRIEGCDEVRLTGSVADWPAYDDTRMIGLDPAQAYLWSPQPPARDRFHLCALPPGIVIQQWGVHTNFARFAFKASPEANSDGQISLWNWAGEALAGVQAGESHGLTEPGCDLEDAASGASAHPDGKGLFIHPPWKLKSVPGETNIAFIEFRLSLPNQKGIEFRSGVHLREGAAGKSDGVRFRVRVSNAKESLWAQLLNDKIKPELLRLDLSSLAGQSVRVRLEADAGPRNDPSYDWGRFDRPCIAKAAVQSPATGTIRFNGAPKPKEALCGLGQVPIQTDDKGASKLTLPLPGSVVFPFAEPATAQLPLDLLAQPMENHLVHGDGTESAPTGFMVGGSITAACGGRSRRALALHPPPNGQSTADFLLRLPEKPARLVTAIGIRDGSKSDGVGFAVRVNGAEIARRSLNPPTAWVPFEADLSRWRGQPVLLSLVTDAEGDYAFDWAVWAEPRLEGTR